MLSVQGNKGNMTHGSNNYEDLTLNVFEYRLPQHFVILVRPVMLNNKKEGGNLRKPPNQELKTPARVAALLVEFENRFSLPIQFLYMNYEFGHIKKFITKIAMLENNVKGEN